ncbi:class I SAM-dependent methyltransferase [Nitrospirales bacterium NOB]|nr:class I SAM-dependent methyltransferase [Nitrospirales bacterium NOB]
MADDPVPSFVMAVYGADAHAYLRYRQSAHGSPERELHDCLAQLIARDTPSGRRVLDIGCGFDGYLQATSFASYIGIDSSSAMLSLHPLRARPNVTLIQADVDDFDYLSLDYNVFVAALVLNYVKDPVRLLARVRRRSCYFYIILPNPAYDRAACRAVTNVVELERDGFRFVYYSHSILDIQRILQPSDDLKLSEHGQSGPGVPHMYVCLSGRW